MIFTKKNLLAAVTCLTPLLFTGCSPDDAADSLTDSFKYTAHLESASTILSIDSQTVYAMSAYGQNKEFADNSYPDTSAGDHLILKDSSSAPKLTIELSSDNNTINKFEYTDANNITYNEFHGSYGPCKFVTSSDKYTSDMDDSGIIDYKITYYNCPITDASLTNTNNESVTIADGNITVVETYYKIDYLGAL